MEKKKMEKAIDVFEKARKAEEIKVVVELPLDGDKKFKAILTAPDLYSIQEEQTKLYKIKLGEIRAEYGASADLPIDEREWQEELLKYKPKTRARLEKERPKNLGEQIAMQLSAMFTPQTILPKYLRDIETGELLFNDPDSTKRFKNLLAKDPELMIAMTVAFGELGKAAMETKEKIKN